MMYLIRQCDKDKAAKLFNTEPEEYFWHVGERRPDIDNHYFEDVVEVYADGHELEYVRENFKNLPDAPNKRGVVWRGDLAQFIYEHLPYQGVAPLQAGEICHFKSEL